MLLLAVLDSAGLPVVGGVDALLVAVASQRPAQAYWAAVCAILGSLAGSSVLFGIAKKGGEVLLMKHISSKRGARIHGWFQRYGLMTVFVPALSPIPMPMKIPVFCAGALQVSWVYFLGVVALARCLRYFTLAYLAKHYGNETFTYLKLHVVGLTAGAAAVAIAAFAVLLLVQRRAAGKRKAVITTDK